ncbi:MAG: thioesterase [Marmoricola sp.]|nr:thioesterase [Marmoricola sp.]
MAEPLCTWTEDVREEWIDYNGHLSEAYYVLVLGHATDEVMATVGLGPTYREETGASLFTVEAHIRYLDQVGPGARLEVRSWLFGSTPKLLWIWHELWSAGTLRATEEILGVHVTGDSSTPFPDVIRARIEAALVPPGSGASRAIRVGPR